MEDKLLSEQFAQELISLLKRLGPTGEIPPVKDLEEWEEKLKSLPPDERDLTRELARFVDLWRYLQERGTTLGKEITHSVAQLRDCPPEARISRLREINTDLMRRIGNDAGTNSRLRQ
jgi:hypothetical protein